MSKERVIVQERFWHRISPRDKGLFYLHLGNLLEG